MEAPARHGVAEKTGALAAGADGIAGALVARLALARPRVARKGAARLVDVGAHGREGARGVRHGRRREDEDLRQFEGNGENARVPEVASVPRSGHVRAVADRRRVAAERADGPSSAVVVFEEGRVDGVAPVRVPRPRREERRPERQLVVRAAPTPPPERQKLGRPGPVAHHQQPAVHGDLGPADAVLVAQQLRAFRQSEVALGRRRAVEGRVAEPGVGVEIEHGLRRVRPVE
mmetsp:Transcript_30811/g.104584  ORF Transcript_30811/g.104584 Transcript_30811/m.104584 type:complete len:232 (-) Transcript_30811:570-1265(-)